MTPARASSSADSSSSTSSLCCGRSRSRFSGSRRSVTAARSSTAPPSPSSQAGCDPGPDGNRARGERRHEVVFVQPAKLPRSRQGGRDPRPPGLSRSAGNSEAVRRGKGIRVGATSDALHRRGGSGEGVKQALCALDPEANGKPSAVDGIGTVRSRNGSTRTGNWPRPSSASPTWTARGWRESRPP